MGGGRMKMGGNQRELGGSNGDKYLDYESGGGCGI